MFAKGMDIAVVHVPAKGRFSIACNLARLKGISLREIIPLLNELERKKGLPEREEWGGHEDRIGSPRQSGSLLAPAEVLERVKATL